MWIYLYIHVTAYLHTSLSTLNMQIHKNYKFVKKKVELIANKDKIAYQQTPRTDMVIKLSLKPKHN